MTKIQDVFYKQFFSFLLGKEKVKLYHTLDWQQAILPFTNPQVKYPAYYQTANFHGIENGYLNPLAPVTYDFVTAFATPPHEYRIRQQLIKQIVGQPTQILDLGCGTGSTTLTLKKTFSSAHVIGLDLSPYMLWMAEYKAQQAGVDINWQHGLAEATHFKDGCFDLITIAMLFHETPPIITQSILQECQRLLSPRGQLLILDGHQQKLRHAEWLIKLFREPYSQVYAQGNLNLWLKHAGFNHSQTFSLGWINQLTNVYQPMQ